MMRRKKLVYRVILGLVFAVCSVLLLWFIGGPRTVLRAELYVESEDLGIPGISKVYGARLVNRGFWPVRVRYCDFVDDAMQRGKMIAYTVERQDSANHNWITVVRANGRDYCKPYPLGIVQAAMKTRLLWPGQSLSTNEEATAARSVFQTGDKARFVVFPENQEDGSSAIPTSDFTIDEHPTTDIPVRVSH